MNPILDIGYEAPHKKTILVIDDELALQSFMFDAFAEQFKIVPAHNGREGLQRAEELEPDLIILDVMMPDISGLEVMGYLKGSEVTKKIPVILTTAKGFDSHLIAELRREPNVVGFLPKPFHVKDIRAIISQSLEKNPPL